MRAHGVLLTPPSPDTVEVVVVQVVRVRADVLPRERCATVAPNNLPELVMCDNGLQRENVLGCVVCSDNAVAKQTLVHDALAVLHSQLVLCRDAPLF
jgi:hypothetical protein